MFLSCRRSIWSSPDSQVRETIAVERNTLLDIYLVYQKKDFYSIQKKVQQELQKDAYSAAGVYC
jgi:hypothetical protein